MQFGPLSQTDVNLLKTALEKQGRSLNVFISNDDLSNLNGVVKAPEFTGHPQFKGAIQALYVEIQTPDLLIVRGLLEKMGHQVGSYEVVELPEQDDFLCPRCKFSSNKKGNCPKHQEPLVDFSTWAELRAKRSNKRGVLIGRIIIGLGIVVVLWGAYHAVVPAKVQGPDGAELEVPNIVPPPANRF